MYSVAIVGAGMSGISLSYFLSESKKYDVFMYECEKIGGINCNILHNSNNKYIPQLFENCKIRQIKSMFVMNNHKMYFNTIAQMFVNMLAARIVKKLDVIYEAQKQNIIFDSPYDMLEYAGISDMLEMSGSHYIIGEYDKYRAWHCVLSKKMLKCHLYGISNCIVKSVCFQQIFKTNALNTMCILSSDIRKKMFIDISVLYKLSKNTKIIHSKFTSNTKNTYNLVVHCHPSKLEHSVKIYALHGKIKKEYECDNIYFKHNHVYLMEYAGNNIWTIFCSLTEDKIFNVIKEYFDGDVAIIASHKYFILTSEVTNDKTLPMGKYLSTLESKIMWAKNVEMMINIQYRNKIKSSLLKKSSSDSS